MIWNTKNRALDIMLNTITLLIFLIIVTVLFTGLFNFIFPKPLPPTDMSFMLYSYLGLPFVFWLLLGFGLSMGLWFHGLKIVSVDSDSHNKSSTYFSDDLSVINKDAITKKR